MLLEEHLAQVPVRRQGPQVLKLLWLSAGARSEDTASLRTSLSADIMPLAD
jgi:hypothetical protein